MGVTPAKALNRRIEAVAHSALCISSWGDSLLPVQSSAATNGLIPTGWDDQIAVAVHMRTYDEAAQPDQSRHACRTQGVRLQPFLPIPMGDRHSGEARLRFRLHRWRAWAVWPGPA